MVMIKVNKEKETSKENEKSEVKLVSDIQDFAYELYEWAGEKNIAT